MKFKRGEIKEEFGTVSCIARRGIMKIDKEK